MKTARFFTSLPDKKVRCELCPHHCTIADGKYGICLTRVNRDGALYSANYCRPVSTAIDPIEKKPLYHFYPGSTIFSTGPNGCTLKCMFCQNAEISQDLIATSELGPDQFAGMIFNSKTIGVAYTYSEPYIWFETILDVGTKVKERGMVNVMVTNGYMEPEPLKELLPLIDAMNIDIKAITPGFYKKLCKAELEPVLRTCEAVKKQCHLEVTNLLVTGENDSLEEIGKLVKYIAENLGRDTPLHFSRYFPRYRMTTAATASETLLRAWEIAKEALDYVYVGNLMADEKSNTHCPKCNTLLIRRSGYFTDITDTLKKIEGKKSLCGACQNEIPVLMR